MERKRDIQRKYVYSSSWLKVREDSFIQDEAERMYNVIERSNSVVIFPITPSGRTVILRHFRYPTQEYSVEVPMGALDDGETIEQAARRELFEEVKISATELKHIGKFNPVPGLTDQQVDVFIARVNETSIDTASFELNEDDIEGLSIVNVNNVFERASSGEITDGFTLGSLLFLKLYLENQDQ
ncbi:MAG: NUDIX hydrolase [Actinobacteria bacterium]|nr:NUDIX hydrolase [Actinomycetota bacterium]